MSKNSVRVSRSMDQDDDDSHSEGPDSQENTPHSKDLDGNNKNKSSTTSRKAQNRIAQREFRLRKQQYIRDLEARVEVLSGDKEERIDLTLLLVKNLLKENKELRGMINKMAGFIGEGLGSCLPRLGLSAPQLDAILHRADTDTAYEAFVNLKASKEMEEANPGLPLGEIRRKSSIGMSGPSNKRKRDSMGRGASGEHEHHDSGMEDERGESKEAIQSQIKRSSGVDPASRNRAVENATGQDGETGIGDYNYLFMSPSATTGGGGGGGTGWTPRPMNNQLPYTFSSSDNMGGSNLSSNPGFPSQGYPAGFNPYLYNNDRSDPSGGNGNEGGGMNQQQPVRGMFPIPGPNQFGSPNQSTGWGPWGAMVGDMSGFGLTLPPSQQISMNGPIQVSNGMVPNFSGAVTSSQSESTGLNSRVPQTNQNGNASASSSRGANESHNKIQTTTNHPKLKLAVANFIGSKGTTDGPNMTAEEIEQRMRAQKNVLDVLRDDEELRKRIEPIQLLSYHINNFRVNHAYVLPPSLRPTAVQRTIPHEHAIDGIPFPSIRDRMILLRGRYDLIEAYQGVFEEWTCRGDDPMDHRNWEISDKWFKDFPILVDDEIIATTNRWRAERGEAPVVRPQESR